MNMLINRSRFSKISVLGAAAAATLLFAGSASAAAAPALTVTPSTGLTDGQTVAVAGSGYVAGTEVGVSQCVNDTTCADATVHTTADANGGFNVSYDVQTTFTATDWNTGETVTVDCAVDDCAIVAWEEVGGPVAHPISFG
ncbi:hypothetical protein LHJ74_27500 [Streptomyces sp. N2-109]|uniref:Neocarzinostatin n=1 Tax=Streptomyces gossypii TaxID=2883101 RepID=A0ABT2K0W4_9ACTN|nr:enediyne antibiotic chromoprotein [Streptomyces gossypii]MCT2593606.1 hypothetical protein [Streptomyces gossypii]